MAILTFPIKLIIGLFLFVISIPILLVGVILSIGLGPDAVDQLMDNCPIMLWWDYLEGRR